MRKQPFRATYGLHANLYRPLRLSEPPAEGWGVTHACPTGFVPAAARDGFHRTLGPSHKYPSANSSQVSRSHHPIGVSAEPRCILFVCTPLSLATEDGASLWRYLASRSPSMVANRLFADRGRMGQGTPTAECVSVAPSPSLSHLLSERAGLCALTRSGAPDRGARQQGGVRRQGRISTPNGQHRMAKNCWSVLDTTECSLCRIGVWLGNSEVGLVGCK
jgi:hypothetical protein